MIGKIPDRPQGGGSYAQLAHYVANVKAAGIKVAWMAYYNLPDDLNASIKCMVATAAINRYCHDPIAHFIISWPHEDFPTAEESNAVVTRLLHLLGLSECQVLAVAQIDTDNYHLHLAINRVHPVSGTALRIGPKFSKDWFRPDRQVKVLRSKESLEAALRLIEDEFGWDSPPHSAFEIIDGKITRKDRYADDDGPCPNADPAEQIREEIRNHLGRPNSLRNWEQVDKHLIKKEATYRIKTRTDRRKKTHRGAVIQWSGHRVAASKVFPQWGLPEMERRLGSLKSMEGFERIGTEASPAAPELPFGIPAPMIELAPFHAAIDAGEYLIFAQNQLGYLRTITVAQSDKLIQYAEKIKEAYSCGETIFITPRSTSRAFIVVDHLTPDDLGNLRQRHRPNLVVDRGDNKYTAIIAINLTSYLDYDAALYAQRELVRNLNKQFHAIEVNARAPILVPGCIDFRRLHVASTNGEAPPSLESLTSKITASSTGFCQITDDLFHELYDDFVAQRAQRKKKKKWLARLEKMILELRKAHADDDYASVYKAHVLDLWEKSISHGDASPLDRVGLDFLVAARLRDCGRDPDEIENTLIAGDSLVPVEYVAAATHAEGIVRWVMSPKGKRLAPPIPELIESWKELEAAAMRSCGPERKPDVGEVPER